jgi:hypothetical protein
MSILISLRLGQPVQHSAIPLVPMEKDKIVLNYTIFANYKYSAIATLSVDTLSGRGCCSIQSNLTPLGVCFGFVLCQ